MSRAIVIIVTLGVFASGCGGSKDAGSASEVSKLTKALRSLKPGEILIDGRREEKFSGPYRFVSRAYVLRFRQHGTARGPVRRLKVSLEGHRGTTRPPYRVVLSTSDASGKVHLEAQGNLYVHIVSTSPEYELRFTPSNLGSAASPNNEGQKH